MEIRVNIDKYSHFPIYVQIADAIINKIRLGEIPYGAKLPTERKMMADSNVSRGSVKKAYDELEKSGFISIIWGSGAYVCYKIFEESAVDESALFTPLSERLSELELSLKEKKTFSEICLERKETFKKINLCAISSSEESLDIYIKTLEKIDGIRCFGFLIDEIRKSKNKVFLSSMFDIFCAPAECEDFVRNNLELKNKKFIVLESEISFEYNDYIHKLGENDEIGIFCQSIAFKDSVNKYFSQKNIRIADKDCAYTKWIRADEFSAFAKDKKAVIIPPVYALSIDDELCKAMYDYIEKGGSFKFFSYSICSISIKLLDEAVRDILFNLK